MMTNKTRRTVLALGLGAVFAGGISYAVKGSSSSAGYEHSFMTAEEMQNSGALVVDIRTPQEWAQTGVIDGARLVEFDFDRPTTFLPQIASEIADGRDLILICRSGNRSRVAAEYLAGQIDNRIVSIEGGMKKVTAAGYRTVPPS